MAEIAQYNQDNLPMKDILSEIRDMVSREAQTRYDAERSESRRELLILRPEARVDLLLQEAAPDIVAETPPEAAGAAALEASLEGEVLRARLAELLGAGGLEALEGLIRKVVREALAEQGTP